MTEASSLLESRWECIARHIKADTRRSGNSIEDYSLDVLRVWIERTPAEIRDARGADFKEKGSAFELMQYNGQKIRRWMKPEVSARPSVEVEECLVLALSEAGRRDCLRDLTARYGGLFVAVCPGVELSVGGAADLMRETAEALQELSSILANGVIDKSDSRPRLLSARSALLDVQAAAVAVMVQIDNALQQQVSSASTDARGVS